MRQIREILRLVYEVGLPARAVARTVRCTHPTVRELVRRFESAGGQWPLPDNLTDSALEEWLYPRPSGRPRQRPEPDWGAIHRALRQRHVTLEQLWQQYKVAHPDGYQYTQFATHYREYVRTLQVVFHRVYHPGEYLFVDYAGDPVPVVDPETGHVHSGHLFVAVLGYSNYTFLELHPDETRASWIQGHQHAFAFFGGVPRIVVPDNPRALIRDRQRDVVLDPTYQEMAAHYHVGVVPARPRHPRDKAKVETGVKIAERAVLGPLENQEVGPLIGWAAAQHYVAMQRDRLNQAPFQKLPGSRWSWFDQDERSRLQPLPAHPFEDGDWRDATVYPHYHIIVDKCYYSVPFHLVGQVVQVRVTASTVEIFADHQRVASHPRAVRPGTYHTVRDHMPPHHQAMAHGWSPEAFLQQARQIGPTWARLFDTLLQRVPVPEQMYPRLRGLVRLHDQFAPTVLEQAAERALTTDITTTRGITAFCRALASSGAPSTDERHPSPPHANLRGPAYYHQEDDCHVTSPSH